MKTNSDSFDLLILGGGSSAFAAAEEALKTSARIVLVEHGPIGGTCLNRGCVPSKFLIHRAETVDHHRDRWPALRSAKNRFVLGGRSSKEAFVRRHRGQLTYLVGHGTFQSPNELLVKGRTLHFKKGVIAVGGRPSIPRVAGLETVPYLTSDSLFDIPRLPRSILILGAGPLGLEMAQMLARFGVDVTLVSNAARLLPKGEPDSGRVVAKVFKKEGMRLLFGSQAMRVEKNRNGIIVTLKNSLGRTRVQRADALLLATGWAANTSGSGFEKTGIRLDDEGRVVVRDDLRTSVPHFWAAGDCVSCHCPNRNVYVAKRQGAMAAANALERHRRPSIDYSAVPHVIFTSPEIATVGVTAAQARARGHRVLVRTLDLGQVPRALLQDETDGVVTLVAEASTQRLLGVSLVSPRAGEVIHEAVVALQASFTIPQLRALFHAYPTYSEALQMCARLFPPPHRSSV